MHDEAYWTSQVERFFEAQTSEAEENELREFLLSPSGADARYEAARAVMSFLSVGREVRGRHATTPSCSMAQSLYGNSHPSARMPRRKAGVFSWAAAVAAIAILSVCVCHVVSDGSRSVCYVYIDGKKTTNVDVVMSQMMQSVRNVEDSGDGQLLQQQMEEIFAPL